MAVGELINGEVNGPAFLLWSAQFGGNPVSMAIAEAVLSVVEEEELQQHAEELGFVLVHGLEGLMEKHPCIGDTRGAGLFLGVDFVKDRETREPDKELADNVVQRLAAGCAS